MKGQKHHEHSSDMTKYYDRWTISEVIEFIQFFPEVGDEVELAYYFHRSPLAIRNLKVRYRRLEVLGGDPGTVRFAYALLNYPLNLLYEDGIDKFIFGKKSVWDDAPRIK